jgi:hypothetical protein
MVGCESTWYAGSKFQNKFSANVWHAVINSQLTGAFFLEGRLTGAISVAFLKHELLGLIEHVPLITQAQTYFQHNGAHPHISQHIWLHAV